MHLWFSLIHSFIIGSRAFCWAMAYFLAWWSYAQSVEPLGREISLSQGGYLHTEQHKHRINMQTSMSRVGFETTIPVFERVKSVYALDSAAWSAVVLVCRWEMRTRLHRDFSSVRLPTQGVTYPGSWSRPTSNVTVYMHSRTDIHNDQYTCTLYS
jgi:hypothetical protein